MLSRGQRAPGPAGALNTFAHGSPIASCASGNLIGVSLGHDSAEAVTAARQRAT